MYQGFATTSRGLEDLLVKELQGFGATGVNKTNAGAYFTASFEVIMQANLSSKVASRIMLQLAFGGYRNEKDIYTLANKIKWGDWFTYKESIKVSSNAIKCPLKSLEYITLHVKDAICDYFNQNYKQRPNVDKTDPDMRIYNFLTQDTVTIYLDTSGETLFKRGYKQDKVNAPLKENLASGVITLSGWDGISPLYDPMCGSGTLITEALSIALKRAPGIGRSFAFEQFRLFKSTDAVNHKFSDSWKNIKLTANKQYLATKNESTLQKKVFASDIDRRSVAIATQNINELGLLDFVQLSCADFVKQKAPIDEQGTLIANPPYGIRLDEQEQLAKLYPLIGDNLKHNYANWKCYFLTGDFRLAKLIKLKASKRIPLYNGAIECRLFEFLMTPLKKSEEYDEVL